MKNRNIVHARQQVSIYQDYYKPSISPLRLIRSVCGILFFGNTFTAHSYVTRKRK